MRTRWTRSVVAAIVMAALYAVFNRFDPVGERDSWIDALASGFIFAVIMVPILVWNRSRDD